MGTHPLESPSLRAELLTTVAALKARRAELMQDVARIDEKLRAAAVLLGQSIGEEGEGAPAGAPAGSSEVRPPKPPETWPELIFYSLYGVQGGKQPKQIMRDAAGTPMQIKAESNPNGLYNTLIRLEGGKKIVRREGRVYLPEVIAAIERGEITESTDEDSASEAASAPALILRVLESHPNGINARGVIRALRNIPEGLERLNRNPQVAYAALSRMVQNAAIIRDERGLYRMPSYDAPAEPETEAASLFDETNRPERLQ